MAETISSIEASPTRFELLFIIDPHMSPDPVLGIFPAADEAGQRRPQTVRADEAHVISLVDILDDLAATGDAATIRQVAAFLHYQSIRLGNGIGMFGEGAAQSPG